MTDKLKIKTYPPISHNAKIQRMETMNKDNVWVGMDKDGDLVVLPLYRGVKY